MTRFQWAIIALLAISVVAVFCTLGIILFVRSGSTISDVPNVVPTPFVVATIAPRPTPRPVCDAGDYVRQSSPIHSEFYDAMKVAANSPRINLSAPISQMQTARRKWENLQAPTCAQQYKSKVTEMMNATIDAFIAFMGNAPDSEVLPLMQKANRLLQEATDELNRLKAQ